MSPAFDLLCILALTGAGVYFPFRWWGKLREGYA